MRTALAFPERLVKKFTCLMSESFLPVLLLMAVAAGIAGVILLLSHLLGPRLSTRRKLDTYESGVPLIDASHKRLSIRYFVVAMVFILFDVEIAFIYPWAIVFRSAGMWLFVEMLIFLAILAVGYAYLWKKGAFDW
ncbi:MAG TPA: NADH-quinone oxidoreductase subunit A [Thermoanaerobaculia bacterium]